MFVKTAVYLRRKQFDYVQSLAIMRKVTVAEVIRDIIDDYRRRHSIGD